MLNLYLLRHGETAFSRQDRFCGQIDVPLTDDGRRMAASFSEAYGDLPWRAIVTSMRARTYDTALPLAKRAGLPIKRDPRLDEMFFGRWQGLSKQEIAGCDAERYALWTRNPACGPPGGELPAAVAARAETAIGDLLRDPGEGHVLEDGEVSCRSVDDVRHLPADLQPADEAAVDSDDAAPVEALGAAE